VSETPTSVRVSEKTYMRLLRVVQELERVQGHRMSMEAALFYVLSEYEDARAEQEAVDSSEEEREDAVRAFNE